MSRDAVLGEVAAEGVEPIRGADKQYFQEYFQRDAQFPLVQKMYDRDVKLRKGTSIKTGAVQYVNAAREADLSQVAGAHEVAGVQDGQLALYNARTAIDVGLCKRTAETRQEVAELYGFSLATDPLGGRQPDAYRWTLRGQVDGAMKESVERIIREVQAKRGNILILTLNCSGNDLRTARAIADDLRRAQNNPSPDDRILTVAFVPESAPSAATVIALGCTDIVMTRPKADAPDAKEAEIGNFESFLNSAKKDDIEPMLASIRELAEAQGYPGILVDGMLKKELEILRATEKANKLHTKLMSREEFERDKADWNDDGTVKPARQTFRLSATQAERVGLARHLVESTDSRDVAVSVYGCRDVKELEPGWLDRFADFLKIPVVTVLLVVIGFAGLILELKVPGLTFPGIIAALCFILVFWSQSRFSGQTFVLALLLFLLGLVLVGLEIFVLPGFGACGISGILCMLAGLALVTLNRIPQTVREWEELAGWASWYMVAMVSSFVVAFLVARFLPKVPYANRLVLSGPAEGAAVDDLPGAAAAAELMGAIGTTNTALRPAGVVRVGDKFVDVVSDGGFIPAGTRVQVIQVEGTRIVVKEV
jgi:membrane-bound ClpP family serine protease